MKKIIKFFMFGFIFLLACIPIMGVTSTEDYQFVNGDTEYIITSSSYDTAEKMFNLIISSESAKMSVQSNILCVFGHSLETGAIKRVTHNVNTTAPKCLEEICLYEVCTRVGCSYSKYDVISTIYIYCH